MEYKLKDGKITQTMEVEIKPQEIKNQLAQLKQRERMVLNNLATVRNEILLLESKIDTVKTETGVEVLLATPVVAEELVK